MWAQLAAIDPDRNCLWPLDWQRHALWRGAFIGPTVHFVEVVWGDQLDIREIAALGDDELTDQKVAAHVAKYATKSAEDSGTVDRSLRCPHCTGRGYQTSPDGFRDLCESCEGTGQSEPITDLPVHGHVREVIRTAWNLGHLPEFAELRLWKWAHMLGFRGHSSSKSRRYSTTLGALRDVRRAWRAEQARPAGAPEASEETTLVRCCTHDRGPGATYTPGPLTCVGVAGFEPTTSSSRTKRAAKLRYTPKQRALL